jgi:hypothetical protein
LPAPHPRWSLRLSRRALVLRGGSPPCPLHRPGPMAQRWPHPIAWRFSSIGMSSSRVPGSPLDVVPFGRRAPHTSGFLAAPFPAGDLGHVVAVFSSGLLAPSLTVIGPPAVRDARWPSRRSPACATTVPSCGRSGMTARIRGGCHRSSLEAGTLGGSPCRGIDRSDEPSACSRGGTARARGRPRPGTPCSVTVEKPASRDVLNGRRNGLVNTGANVGFIRSPDRCVRRPPHRAAPGTSREASRHYRAL